jgi:LmbE family N-acetylglucosaminyl deacetylase
MITPPRKGDKTDMDWIYLSPHLDDAIYSCGGLIWEQTQAGQQVAVWTVCAGDPPPGPLSPFAEALHARWKTGRDTVQQRREEDLAACQTVGAQARHFSVPDCIYRRSPVDGTYLYSSEEAIFGRLHLDDAEQAIEFGRDLFPGLPEDVQFVVPLCLGGHVDHQFVRAAAEVSGRQVWYYADYPYVIKSGKELEKVTEGLQAIDFPVSPEGLAAWGEAVELYASQVSTFWKDLEEMRAQLGAYHGRTGGVRLWRWGV